MRVVICPKCKKTNIGNMTQCLLCKTPLPANIPQTGAVQSTGQPGKKCPACGTLCPPGIKYCPECGIELPPWMQTAPQPTGQRRFCTKCGAPRQGDKPFCTSCGNRFTS